MTSFVCSCSISVSVWLFGYLAISCSTSKLVEGSSMKDEIREGHVITTEAPTPAPKPKKKGNKKNC